MNSATNTQPIQDVNPLGNPPKSIAGWTLRSKRGYWELVRRQDGKTVTKYVGKRWERAFDILPEEEAASPVTAGVRELETPTIQAEQVTEHEDHAKEARKGLPCETQPYCLNHGPTCWRDFRRRCPAPAMIPEAPKARTGAGRWGA